MVRGNTFVQHLAGVPLFSALSKRDLTLLAKRSKSPTVDAGTVIVREGAAGAEFFVIVSGEAEVVRHRKRVATLGPGAFFGDLALLDRAPRNATVTARTPMELVVIGQPEFSKLIDEAPGFARKLLVGLAHRLRECDAKAVQ